MYIQKPMEIENKSMDIIDESLKDVNFEGLDLQIARRMIHTTGDVDYRH
ncbi:MAG: precorrin-8X methylmutase, partial [Ezakiella massiliensis]